MNWIRKRIKNYYVIYTFLFVLIMGAVCFCLVIKNKSLIWEKDGLFQHYIALAYFGKWGREIIKNIFVFHTFQIPLWDFHVGYGSDIITTFHYYAIGDPLNLFSIVVPFRYTEYLYGALIVLRLYLSGASFSFYCFTKKKRKMATLAGAFTYIFCGYMLNAALHHPFFLNPMIYLPLLLVGAERIIQKRRPTLFIFMVFISAISNFYFFYMIAFAVCFYVFVRFFMSKHEHLLKELAVTLGRFFCYACVGVFLSAVILLPVLLQFSETSRMDTEQIYEPLYKISFYRDFFARFMVAGRVDNGWTRLGFTAPAVLAIIVLFGKRKQHTALKVSFLIMTGMLWIPLFGKVMNGFAYVSNRWCWIYAGLICYILVTVWEDMLELKNTSSVFVLVLSIAYFVSIFVLGDKEVGIFYGSLFLAAVLLVFAAARFLGNRYRFAVMSGMMCILFLHVLLNCYASFGGAMGNRKPNLVKLGTAMKQVAQTAPYAVKSAVSEEEGFYRFEMDEFKVVNTASLAEVNGISYYWSLENASISKYLGDMSPNRFRLYNFRDLDHRTFLDAVAGVKYFVQQCSDYVPFGYEQKDTVFIGKKEYRIYENKYALPFGYTYKSYIPYQSYQNMLPLYRQEALLQGIVLEESEEGSFSGISEESPVFISRFLEHTISCGEDVVQQPDGSFAVGKNGGWVKLEFSGMDNCETYLIVKGVDISTNNPRNGEFDLRIASDDSHNRLQYHTPYHKLYTGQKDFIVNLGYHKQAQSSITISFPRKGTYRFKDMKVICQPMENYIGQIEELRKYKLENEEFGVNTVKGTISLPKERILCLSIPYTKGWHAIVDGKKETLRRANVMYMALPLEKGEHTIELYYRTSGLYAGIGLSSLGLLLFVGITLYYRNTRNPGNKAKTA